ncbi:hypothetical protein TNCT_498711, partial [Trichonephila clavata]
HCSTGDPSSRDKTASLVTSAALLAEEADINTIPIIEQ